MRALRAHDRAMSATEMQGHLHELRAERALVLFEGLRGDSAHLTDLNDGIAATHHAYVGTAVTEIASCAPSCSARNRAESRPGSHLTNIDHRRD
jgi:hypothetical protein